MSLIIGSVSGTGKIEFSELQEASSKPLLEPIQERESEKQKEIAAIVIQRLCRKHQACESLRLLHIEKQKTSAAVKIQKMWRGYQGRIIAERMRRPIFLSGALLSQAVGYIDDPLGLDGQPRATAGITPVYLPKGSPIVLKKSGFSGAQSRLEKMGLAQEICIKNRYRHLVIPSACTYKDFIVEGRLPLGSCDPLMQIGLYVENRDRFTKAAEEFTGFLYQSSLDDVTMGPQYCCMYNFLSESPMMRYDNLPLYVEHGEGKIGLIDLEKSHPLQKGERGSIFPRCINAIRLFPYQYNEILRVAKKFDPNVEKHCGLLQWERDEALKRVQILYEDHLSFIQAKGIGYENPGKSVEITAERRNEIGTKIFQRFLNFYKDCHCAKDIVSKDPEKASRDFQDSFPKILEMICVFMQKILQKKSVSFQKPISTTIQLLGCRTVSLFDPIGDEPCWREFLDQMHYEPIVQELVVKACEDNFCVWIADQIFEELALGKEICYYYCDHKPELGPTVDYKFGILF